MSDPRATLRNIYWWLGQRTIIVPWVANLANYNLKALRWLPGRFSEHKLDYRDFPGRWGLHPGVIGDRAANFFVRAAMEADSQFIIEAGAFDGWRSMMLARLFPEKRVYALDVNQQFVEWRNETNNLVVAFNDHKVLRRITTENEGKRGLFCCTGTLTYYRPEEVVALFTLLHDAGVSVALDEPNSSITETTRLVSLRRTRQSWYHPYTALLQAAGYKVADNGAAQQDHTWGVNAEERNCIYAVAS